jgi:hypothetical protein
VLFGSNGNLYTVCTQSDVCICTHILHDRDSGRGKEIQKLGQQWMERPRKLFPRAILDTRAVGSSALAYSIPPSAFHTSTLCKHGGWSLNGWYRASSHGVSLKLFVNANRGKFCYSGSFLSKPQGCLEQTSRNRHVTYWTHTVCSVKLPRTLCAASCSQSPKREDQTDSNVVPFPRIFRF